MLPQSFYFDNVVIFLAKLEVVHPFYHEGKSSMEQSYHMLMMT